MLVTTQSTGAVKVTKRNFPAPTDFTIYEQKQINK